ncbi:MAG: PAS domain S-box protein, partial [Spirochaetales bacterium]|nr:PAS domain S-box protein [Spirochaetales bacterium]
MRLLKTNQLIQSRFLFAIIPIFMVMVIATAVIFFRYSGIIKEQSIREIQERTVNDIRVRLDTLLAVPYRINSLNQGYLQELCPIAAADDKIQRQFASQLKVFPETNLIAVGMSDGEYTEAQRLDDGSLRVGARGRETGGDLLFWRLDADTLRVPSSDSVPGYDPLKRPWYVSSLERKDAGWSQVYLYSSNSQPAISANQPFYGKDCEIHGVLTTSITLNDIGSFLKSIDGRGNGMVFLVEPDGLLIASSTDTPLVDGSGSRVNIASQMNLRAATERLFGLLPGNSEIPSMVSGKLRIDGKSFRGTIARYNGPLGRLDWRILMFLPAQFFLPNTEWSLIAGSILVLLVFGLTVFSVLKLSSWISRPVYELAAHVSSIADAPGVLLSKDIPQKILSRRDEIGFFARTFRKMTLRLNKAFLALEEEQRKYRQLVEDTGSVVLKVSGEGIIRFCNEYGLKVFGFDQRDMTGLHIRDLVGDEMVNRFLSEVLPRVSTTPAVFEGDVLHPAGRHAWVTWSIRTVDPEVPGERPDILCTGQDITDRHLMEEQLTRSLEEKQVLLNEIHHRVKNNLQIIISMLNLQGMKTEAPEIAGTINTIKRRIMSMSLVHELLYRSDSLSRISLGGYLRALIDAVKTTFGTESRRIKVTLETDEIETSIETSLTIGLVVNELLSNSYKHAFHSRDTGVIQIAAKKGEDGTLVIRVADNGSGYREPDTPAGGSGLGTLLINALTSQLDARIQVTSSDGTVTEII